MKLFTSGKINCADSNRISISRFEQEAQPLFPKTAIYFQKKEGREELKRKMTRSGAISAETSHCM
ncbi:MAG: hypothetical protein EOM12_05765 [Verrucomicrobiae bacterium]|nr:hypothetical protein [Verrucomicrobiae bacterium]